ncbi:MAG: class I SAM-dependent methyltransferase [Aphanothece sp. CMT-3BRIN-NPC111]|jgi:ubiquinone/menaquinone biosynthesis C-methylase UbiE|nr:class I SAM-dependent methyltransferase [Aphanothece sp. CMT-3BRIN-NPC111]
MEFTGERYVPSVKGEIKYEHLHRYALSLELVSGKSVLDLASGEGYGSALLAKVAQSVIGVDIDPESVEHAKQQYNGTQNLKFLVGSCDSVPLPNGSVEVVTSFETIEHHDRHEEMMREIKRVLKPGGLLIISSPNRLTYSDEPNISNPFHIKELYYEELNSLLSRHFKYITMFGQRLATASFVFPLQEAYQTSIKTYTGSMNNLTQKFCILNSPIYFIAICSEEAESLQRNIDSVYIDRYDDLLKVIQNDLHQTKEILERSQIELQQTQAQLQQTQTTITAMESSKFWKLRRAWIGMKGVLGIERDG